MFWVWYEWMVFVEPYNFNDDGDTIKLNERSLKMWQSMPEKYRGLAIIIEVIMENA